MTSGHLRVDYVVIRTSRMHQSLEELAKYKTSLVRWDKEIEAIASTNWWAPFTINNLKLKLDINQHMKIQINILII